MAFIGSLKKFLFTQFFDFNEAESIFLSIDLHPCFQLAGTSWEVDLVKPALCLGVKDVLVEDLVPDFQRGGMSFLEQLTPATCDAVGPCRADIDLVVSEVAIKQAPTPPVLARQAHFTLAIGTDPCGNLVKSG